MKDKMLNKGPFDSVIFKKTIFNVNYFFFSMIKINI